MPFHLQKSHSSSLPRTLDYRREPILPAVQCTVQYSIIKTCRPSAPHILEFSAVYREEIRVVTNYCPCGRRKNKVGQRACVHTQNSGQEDRQYRSGHCSPSLLEKFWQISLYVTNDAIAKLYVCDVKFRQIEENGRQFSYI